MFLGRALTGGDIEDVDSTDVVDRVARARPDAAPDAAEPAGSIEEPAFRSFEPPKFERPSYESLSAAMAAAEQRQAVAQEPTFDSPAAAIVENQQPVEVQACGRPRRRRWSLKRCRSK